MNPKLLLRIASILILIHCILHTFGFSGWKDDPDPARHAVIQLMTGPKLKFMGTYRNMGNYYDGFGYASSIALLLIAVILWVVSGELVSKTMLAAKIMLVISFMLLLWGVDELIFFFPFAAAITLTSSLCCLWAFFRFVKRL
jgi:hypothetical protein